MLESRSETFPPNFDVLHSDECVNAKKDNSNDDSIASCKNNLSSTKNFNHSTSLSSPTMIINEEEKEIESTNNMLNASNMSEYSMEMLALLTSSTMAMASVENHHHHQHQHSGSVKNGTTKKRKSKKFKPSSVWKHFLRLSDGNVRCVHCAKILKRKDSSTKTMWGHLRAIHFKGGGDMMILQQQTLRDRNRTEITCMDELDPSRIITTQNWLEQRVGILCDKSQGSQSMNNLITGQLDDSSTESFPWTPTQSYIKRNRSSSYISNGCITNLKNIDHKVINDSTYNGKSLNATLSTFAQSDRNIEEKSLNFLSSIPHTPEIINITAGYVGNADHQCIAVNGKLEETGNNGYSNTDISTASLNASNSLLSSVQNHLNVNTDQTISSITSTLPHILDSFSIFDPESMAIFMRAATDLDCTLSFHCRNNQPQLSFESNRTAANKLKGAEVCMTEMNDEVHIVMRTDGGTEIDREYWKKTDKAQFMWAIRGKCQKVLTQ